MLKKIFTFVMLLAIVLVFAAKLERQGNELAAKGDEAFKEKKYNDAGETYLKAMEMYKKAQKEEDIPLKDKIENMENNAKAAFANAQNWDKYIELLIIDYNRKPSNAAKASKIMSFYSSKKRANNPEKALEFGLEFEKKYSNYKIESKIANIYVDKNEYEKAAEWYNKSFEKKAASSTIKNIASLYLRLNKPNKAIEAYTKFLGMKISDKEKSDTYANMSKLYEDLNDTKKQIEFLEKSVATRNNIRYQIKLMSLYYDFKDYNKALEKANLVIKQNSKQADAIFYKGQILYKQNKYKEAKEVFQKITNNQKYGSNAKGYIKAIDSK